MNQQDVERIARAALRDLGAPGAMVSVTADPRRSGHWRIEIRGPQRPGPLRIVCGEGSSAQWVRSQIVDQYLA